MASLRELETTECDPGGDTALVLVILTVVSFFNYMDRMVLSVLLEPIKADLALDDAQLGLLSGLAFAALYAVMGIPLARVADRSSRVRLLAICLGLWSPMTAACGLSRSFLHLFLARVGVGVGEAGCLPAAHSLIGDYYPPERRAFAVSIFQAGAFAGLSGGLLITGFLAEWLGWRGAMMVVGFAGVPLALIVAIVLKEPARRGQEAVVAVEGAWQAIHGLVRRPGFVHLVIAISIGGFGNYGVAQWLPSFYMRSHGLSLSAVGIWLGIASGVGGMVGTLSGGYLAVKLMPRNARWELWLPAMGYAAAVPAYALVFLSNSFGAAISLNLAATMLVASGGGVALSAIQSFAEPHRRATAVSLALFLSSLVGVGLGPFAVGLASDAMRSTLGEESLRYALLGSTLTLALAGGHFLLAARRPAPAAP